MWICGWPAANRAPQAHVKHLLLLSFARNASKFNMQLPACDSSRCRLLVSVVIKYAAPRLLTVFNGKLTVARAPSFLSQLVVQFFYSAGLCLTYRKSCPCEASCQCVAPFRSAHASSGRTFFQANCTLIASQIFRLTLQLQPPTHRTPLDRLSCSMCFQVKLRVADVTLQGCLKVVGCLLVLFLCMEVLVQRAEIGQDVHIYNVLYKVSPTHSVPPRAQSVLLLHT